jgi:hypothetical protein
MRMIGYERVGWGCWVEISKTPDVRALWFTFHYGDVCYHPRPPCQSLDQCPSEESSLVCQSLTKMCHTQPQRTNQAGLRSTVPRVRPCFRMCSRRVAPMPTLRIKFQPVVPRNETHIPSMFAKVCGCSDDLIHSIAEREPLPRVAQRLLAVKRRCRHERQDA